MTTAGLCRAADVTDTAKYFDATPEMILQALEENDMHAEAVDEAGFDLELAQMDIKVSPPGVSKIELAKGLYEEYLDARRQVVAARRATATAGTSEFFEEQGESPQDIESPAPAGPQALDQAQNAAPEQETSPA